MQGFLHGQVGTLAIGRGGGLVESVAAIAVATQLAQNRRITVQGRLFGFQNQIGGSFTQIQSIALGVKRFAGFAVQDHQGVEAVEVEFRQAFCASDYRNLRSAVFDKVCSQNYRVSGGGAGGGDGAGEFELSRKFLGNHLGACSAVMQANILVATVILLKVTVILLAFFHAADRVAGNKNDCVRGRRT